jgi:NADPH2:quinone reductase
MSARQAVWLREHGGPEVMRLETSEVPSPGPGEALVRIVASGINFHDVGQRTGRSKVTLPVIMGNEASGIVEAVGPSVREVRAGDRVIWVIHQGTYATHAVVPAEKLVPVRDGFDMTLAAALPMQGLMAHGLTTHTYPVRPGDVVLVQAAASGIGGLLCQVAKIHGARVIGTVSTRAKAEHARARGADEVVVRADADVAAEVKRLSDGRGAHVAYDGVGAATFQSSLDSLRPHGTLAIYGQASGPHPLVDTTWLSARGGLCVTRSVLGHFTPDRASLLDRMKELFGWIADGRLRLDVAKRYPLGDAADAHRDLESGTAVGKILLEVGA